MDPLAGITGNEVQNHQIERPLSTPVLDSEITEFEEEEFWTLSGKPYFNAIMTMSNVKPAYQLFPPAKILPYLPSNFARVVLTYCGKNWEMFYHGDRPNKKGKQFDSTWKTFVNDNDLKVGDACVFELTECSSELIKFRVQILRGDFPSELLERVNGESSHTPIVLE